MKSVLTWLLIIVPLGWGVTKSVQKSLPLFRGEAGPADASVPVFQDLKAWRGNNFGVPASK